MTEATTETATPRVPKPLVYGPAFPIFNMVMRDGDTRFESTQNQNLYLDADDFDERGTYSLSTFLRALSPCQGCGNRDNRERWACPLVLEDVEWAESAAGHSYPETWKARTEPGFDECPGIALLFAYCQTDVQRAFLNGYMRMLYTRDVGASVNFMQGEPEALIGGPDPFASRQLMRCVERFLLDQMFPFPALIPEVWLNAIGRRDRTLEDEEHLKENQQRVDFVLFAEGKRVVIEIDGPSHYATFDESTRRYEVSEQRYTKNLRVERSLRRQGWEIHRFSNYEISTTEGEEARKLLAGLPGAKRSVGTSYDEFWTITWEFNHKNPTRDIFWQ